MNEVRKSEFAGAMPNFGGPFAQVSSDATRRLCEQGQSVAKTIANGTPRRATSSATASLGMARHWGA